MNDLLLFDRLEVIKKTINKYGEENFYLSFSGGKDSTVVHYLLDMALPNNKIKRVFSNTGIEYNSIVRFVNALKENDDRFEIILPKKNIKATLEDVGYPFKSKEHSSKLGLYQRGSRSRSVMRYLNGENKSTKYACPKSLRYQFTEDFNIKISEFCCYELKKKPFLKWEKDNKKTIVITGMLQEEKGQRENIDCLVFKTGKLVKFHPLSKITSDWEEWFIRKYNIKLCDLYYSPFNFKRTGCKGCPFTLNLQQQLEIMDLYLPSERKQCETIWKPIYNEYRRIGFRLEKDETERLF